MPIAGESSHIENIGRRSVEGEKRGIVVDVWLIWC